MGIDVYQVAEFFLSKVDLESGDTLTHLKLQKLTYYAQAWHLAVYNEPLFDGHFEAWKNGPVHPELYHSYKHFGWNPIPPQEFKGLLTSQQKQLLDDVWSNFGKYEAKYLEHLTHQELPWLEARGDLPEGASCNESIDEETMAHFYRKHSAVIKMSISEPDSYAAVERHQMTDARKSAWKKAFGRLTHHIPRSEDENIH
ncbi:MAG: Panacea domain-containing protein [Tumebacillaceae bacterium]